MDWTEDQHQFVEQRWRTPMSSTDIAKQMTMIFDRDFNRNMIIGYANRHGFPPKKVKRVFKARIVNHFVEWNQGEIDTLTYMWPTQGVKTIKFALKTRHGTNRRLIEIKTKALRLGLKKFKKTKTKEKPLTPTIKFSENINGCRYIFGEPDRNAMCCGRECSGTYCEYHQNKCSKKVRL